MQWFWSFVCLVHIRNQIYLHMAKAVFLFIVYLYNITNINWTKICIQNVPSTSLHIPNENGYYELIINTMIPWLQTGQQCRGLCNWSIIVFPWPMISCPDVQASIFHAVITKRVTAAIDYVCYICQIYYWRDI